MVGYRLRYLQSQLLPYLQSTGAACPEGHGIECTVTLCDGGYNRDIHSGRSTSDGPQAVVRVSASAESATAWLMLICCADFVRAWCVKTRDPMVTRRGVSIVGEGSYHHMILSIHRATENP